MLGEDSARVGPRLLAKALGAAHLQTVVADHAEQRDDGVEDGQEAQCGQHVAGALLQDKLVHVEERVLVALFVFAPAVLAVLVLVLLACDLSSTVVGRIIEPTASVCVCDDFTVI